MKRKSQSGNMLVYILGAVFLLGILFVAMRSGYQPGAGIDAEGAILKATQIQKYASELERGVQQVLRNGHSEVDIRFAHVSNPGYGTPGDIPARQVFESGGNVEWQSPPSGTQVTVTPWIFNARNSVDDVGTSCPQNSCVDLVAFLPDVTQEICIALNNSAGVTNPLGVPPKEGSSLELATKFNGVYDYFTGLDTTGFYTRYKKEGCFEGNGGGALTGHYYYYRVLLAR